MQLGAEIYYRPDSSLTRQILAWYDALYSASQDIDSYSIPSAPLLTNNAEKQSYIWSIILTMSKADASNALKVLTKDNQKRLN